MIKFGETRVVTIDCDDTLIAWSYENIPHDESELVEMNTEHGTWKFLPNKYNIELLKSVKRQGCKVVVWSAAGGLWAQKTVELLGLQNFVDITLSKPEFAIDDLLEAKRIIKQVVWRDPKTGEFKRST